MRQIAVRLGGSYHNGNEKHISTLALKLISQTAGASRLERLTRREYALIACGLGACIFALLPLALQLFGTAWTPGVSASARNGRSSDKPSRVAAPTVAAGTG